MKPANVLVTGDGRPKVLDFGIARATGLGIHSTLQTAHGGFVGTLAYMSPEQLRGTTGEVDGRSDVYALGVMLYRLMAGRLPFDVGGLPLLEAAQQILHADVPALGSIDPALAGSIEQVARRAMSRDRGRRYQSAADLALDLRACLEGRAPIPMQSLDLAHMTPPSGPLVTENTDRGLVAIGLATETVLLLDATSGAQRRIVQGDGTRLERLAFDGRGRLSIGWADGRVELIGVTDAV